MGEWKLLLPWGDSTIVETVVSNALEAGLEALVVAGFRGDELHTLLDGRPAVTLVDNPHWREGMLGSILCALDRVRGEAFFVTPADMPLIGPGIYRRILAEARSAAMTEAARAVATAQAAIARPGGLESRDNVGSEGNTLFAACDGRLGHPVLIPLDRMEAMRKLDRGGKMRDFLMRGPWRLVETGDRAVLADIDNPADFAAARGGPY